ncbi:MAG: phosphoribosylformimino-5-aminoimidazole carboxamide ribotide isomerase [Desulfosarcinaceae bacterium]|nr:phosphoribosylformimino-5-aminoimidazole carboxamide ribotide isomerase [Desulfosarcinaceae bacterium]
MRFRPCIDLHQGVVKQIVGATLDDDDSAAVTTNFEARRPAGWFAERYRRDGLTGGHVICLGQGNTTAARDALAAWPGGLQIGGGVNLENAAAWLDAGAAAVIVTSWVFHDGLLDRRRLTQLSQRVGPQRLVLDLSCRLKDGAYYIVTDRWQRFTQEKISAALLADLSTYCSEYLVHAVDVEGKCSGIEADLVALLAGCSERPITYAGGIHHQDDLDLIETMGQGRIDFTVGSALDLFGGSGFAYTDLAARYGPGRKIG